MCSLLAVAAILAAGALASSAAAQHTVEILDEGSSEPCGQFAMSEHLPVEGNCTVQFSGTLELYGHTGLSEVLFSECDYQFEAVFNSIGFGYLYNQVMTPEGEACAREPCDEGPGSGGTGIAPHRNLPWQAQINEAGSGSEKLRAVLCQRGFSSDPATEGTPGSICVVDFNVETAGHSYELATEPDFQGNGGSPCVNFANQFIEVEGSLASEPSENHPGDIEIRHLDD